ncbi:MAG: ATP-binding protein [Bifidobacteriaceae bacterium]|nr:ATP-binding protein [Bifidobacteriaceae bacterium]
MERRLERDLVAWQQRTTGRSPLVLFGARQVGKTHLLRQFGQRYRNVAYVNFEATAAARSFFDGDLDPRRLLGLLEAETRQAITPGETLVILDEVQACPVALTAMKYFREQAPQYHIACAGSLLGVSVQRDRASFPVGNVTSMTLHPLDFEEYLWARDEARLATAIREAFAASEPLPQGLHDRALDYYRTYLVTGGMPAAVVRTVETGSLQTVGEVQEQILNDYVADMVKYATTTEAVRIRSAFASLPAQLAKDNRKFQYKVVRRGGTATIFGPAIDWLCSAGLVLKCSRVNQATVPLPAQVDLASFKLYMGDIGLLTHMSAMPQSAVLAASLVDHTFLGALAENYVAQALAANGHTPRYWTSEGKAEVDFILQLDSDIVGVEVKAGHRTQSKSLGVLANRYRVAYSIRFSAKNFGAAGGIRPVPLYAAFCV